MFLYRIGLYGPQNCTDLRNDKLTHRGNVHSVDVYALWWKNDTNNTVSRISYPIAFHGSQTSGNFSLIMQLGPYQALGMERFHHKFPLITTLP
jgi:hypothetical protein